MKERISITLSASVMAEVDKLAGSKQSRSAFLERVLRSYLHVQERRTMALHEIELIDAKADRLNVEAEEVLEYQTPTVLR